MGKSHIDKFETRMQPVQLPNQSTVNKLTGNITISFLSTGNKLTLQKIQLQEQVQQKEDIEELKVIAPNILSLIDRLIKNYNGENLNFQIDTRESEYLSKMDSVFS